MSQFPRSTRAGIIPVLAGVVFALAGCRDSTGVDTPPSLGHLVAPKTGANASVSPSVPQMLVYGTYQGGDQLQAYLGATATRSATLPDDLTPYKVIWYIDPVNFISNEDGARLVAFVQRGGGLYLSGEGTCCDLVNASIGNVVAALVKNSANIQVGGIGPVFPIGPYLINPNTEIASLPTSLSDATTWNTVDPGGMLNVPPPNQFIMATPLTTVAAAWDAPNLVGGYGRLVVMMDVNWLEPAYFTTESFAILGNITRFLFKAPEPNRAPTASAGGPYTGIEGNAVGFSAAGSSDPDGDALTYAWDLNLDGNYDDATGSTATRTFGDNGIYTVRVLVSDSKGGSAVASATVTINNRKPTMTFSAPTTVIEGSPITLTASNAADVPADQSSLTITYSCDGGATFGTTASCAATDGPATVNVVGRVTDKDGGYSDYAQSVAVTNAAPVIASLTLPVIPVPLGTTVSLAGSFSDPWTDDGHAALVDWGDGSTSNGTVGAVVNPRTVSATHTYTAPGVYAVALTVTDDAGAQDSKLDQYVVVYDPSAGFVTGSGWIAYGTTACPVLCGGATGRGDFGFVAKYQKGATVPTGDTRFEFHAATLVFASVEYEWLVVAGKRAQFKGRGTINGAGDYGFLLTAVDDATDAFRIKIWDRLTNVVVFDNKMGSNDDSSDTTLLDKVSGNGSIVIHAK